MNPSWKTGNKEDITLEEIYEILKKEYIIQ